MSLRLRLLVVVTLSVVAVIAAAVAMLQVLRDTDAARVASASASNEAAVLALARAHRDRGVRGHDPAAETALRASAVGALSSVVETVGGYCFADGFLIEEFGAMHPGAPPPPPGFGPPPGHGPPGGHGPRPGPPPDLRQSLTVACSAAASGRVDRRLTERERDTFVVSVTAVDGDVAAFAVRAIPKRPSTGPLGVSFLLAAMAAITLVLVVVSVDAMLAVRRGTGDLERALEVLESDLRAEVVPPRAKELAAIARRLRSMAERLADARDRERALERRVAHEARLGALGRLVAGVAHEIRNPLTGVHLLLDGIRRHSADARVQGDVDTALGEIARLDHVVGSLLGVARDARTEPAPLDVGEVVDERLRTMKELAAARGLTLDRRGDARATAERDVLVRVVDNLVRNAIEASPSGAAVVVEVGVTGGLVVVDVVDRGEGVPGDRVSQLFEPFFTLKPDGTGLGLWLSRALAEARGWALLYLREDGATRFSLRLPEVP